MHGKLDIVVRPSRLHVQAGRLHHKGSPSCFFGSILTAALLLAGCGGSDLEFGRVSGKVTFEGRPVTAGVVYFVPERGPGASGALDEEGRYELTTHSPGDGTVVGRHRVYFAPVVPEDHLAGYTEADYAAGRLPPEPPKRDFLPRQYLSVETSGLAVEVTPGSNTHDFGL